MTPAERRDGLMARGFTPRQAGFLELVMLHAGVCVPRQYTAYCGIKFGHATRDFFDRLTRTRYATAYPCRRNGARIFHIHHKGLYSAIGEPDNRNRKRATLSRALERLLILDGLLSHELRCVQWFGTPEEKVAYFLSTGRVTRADLPALRFARGGRLEERYFWHKHPIGMFAGDPICRFLVPFTDARGRGLRAWLTDHRRLLERMPRWRLEIVAPRSLANMTRTADATMRDFFAPALQLRVVEEFRWYCEARRDIEAGAQSPSTSSARYVTARRAYGSRRFYDAYRRWRQHPESRVFEELRSGHLHEAWQHQHVGWTCHIIDHEYQHLLPVLVGAPDAL